MIIEIKNILGDVIFTHDCEDNTIKNTMDIIMNNLANINDANIKGQVLAVKSLSMQFQYGYSYP